MHHHRKILDSAVHRDRGMWGRGRAARLVGSVISLSVAPHYGRAGRSCIWTCREIMHMDVQGDHVYGRAGRSCIWTCREIMYMDVPEDHVEITQDGRRVGGRGGAYAAAVGAGVAQKKRPPACLVSRCHRVHAFGDFVLMRKAGTWLALELL